MKNILILCRRDERTDYDQIDTYAAGMSTIESHCAYSYGELEQLVFSYDGSELHVDLNGSDISKFDEVFMIGWFKTKILEDIALSAAKYMDFHGKPVHNTEVLFTRSRSKLSQYVVAALNDITLTPFLFCKDTQLFAEVYKQYWTADGPVILKGVQASRGNDNYLLHTEEEVLSTLKLTDPEVGPWFVMQGFVPNNGDYRIIVMGDQVRYVIHRLAQSDTHLNNTSKGGSASEMLVEDLPQEVRDQCARLAKLLRREITGVDMIQHNETKVFYLLEINNMPQMATGSLVQKKLEALDSYFASRQQ